MDAFAEVEVVEQLFGTRLCLFLVLAGDEGWNADILQRRELRQELMELEDKAEVLVTELSQVFVLESGHINPVDKDGASVGGVEGAHDLQEGGFACS